MSRATELAAAIIGGGLGYDNGHMDHTDNMHSDEDIKLYSEAAYYAPIAAAMVEAAYGITFQYPRDWQWEIYRYFGECIGDHVVSDTVDDPDADDNEDEDWDDDDDDDDDDEDNTKEIIILPERPMMLDLLETLVYNNFINVCESALHGKLKEAIAQARKETA